MTCHTCQAIHGEKSHNVAKAIKDLDFNEVVCVDTFEVELSWGKLELLNIVDIGTRFQICIPLWKVIEVKHVRKACH